MNGEAISTICANVSLRQFRGRHTRGGSAELFNMALILLGIQSKRKREQAVSGQTHSAGYKTFSLEPHTELGKELVVEHRILLLQSFKLA